MIKTFCDICKKEITRDYVGEAYRPTLMVDGYLFQAEVAIGGYSGDLCKECVLKIVNEGKESYD